jgi:phage-related tail protein
MANKRLSATITIGGAVAGSLAGAFGAVKGHIGKVGDAIRKLEDEQKKLGKSIYTYAGHSSKALGELVAKHKLITRELEKQRSIASAKTGMAAGKAQMGSAAIGLGIVGAVAGAAAFPIVQAAKFETAMLGVAKQVDGARDGSGKLTSVYFDMKRQIQALGREMPMATTEIAAMVTAGARMGIARDELIDFTKTAGMMAEAFELPAAELADQMGQIQKLFGLKTQGEIRALADSVNYLDDNAISKGGDIVEFLQRVGGVAGSVKISGQQMAALGSTMLTLGTKTSVAGTAVNAIFSKLAQPQERAKRHAGRRTRHAAQGAR